MIYLALFGILALLLAGCQSAGSSSEPERIGVERSAVRFDHPDFQHSEPEYWKQRDARTGDEVHGARFVGRERLGVVATFLAGSGRVIEPWPTESLVRRLIGDELTIEWGGSGRVSLADGYGQYRFFEFRGEPARCFGFSRQFGFGAGDDRNRMRNAIFGYFCRNGSQPFEASEMRDVLGRVRVARPA